MFSLPILSQIVAHPQTPPLPSPSITSPPLLFSFSNCNQLLPVIDDQSLISVEYFSPVSLWQTMRFMVGFCISSDTFLWLVQDYKKATELKAKNCLKRMGLGHKHHDYFVHWQNLLVSGMFN